MPVVLEKERNMKARNYHIFFVCILRATFEKLESS